MLGLVHATKHSLQAGFTLLEMILVLFLVSLMASTTLMLTEGIEDQAKYDETKRRMEIMRKAIVGDPTRTVNGSPEISGFVADMGRLPLCVAELLELGAEKSPATAPKTYVSPCDISATITVWNIDASTGVASGWNGPYLQVLPERDGGFRFRDGYSNSDASDALNSGWGNFGVSGSNINLLSNGFNLTLNTDDIEASPLVVSADWQVQLPATVNITFKNQSASDLPLSDQNLVLRIYLSNLSSAVDGDDGTNDYLVLEASNAVIANSSKTKNFTLLTSPNIAIGGRAYSIVCYEQPATGDSNDYVIFDGDCDAGNDSQNTSNIRSFNVFPRQSLNLNLDWIIQ